MFFSKLQFICHCRLMISTQLTQLSWLVAKLSGGEMTGNRRKPALFPTIRNVPSETLPKKLKPLMKRYTSNSLNFQIILLSHSNSSVQAFFNKQRKTVKYGKKNFTSFFLWKEDYRVLGTEYWREMEKRMPWRNHHTAYDSRSRFSQL